ncbi:hypothetical protein CTA2_12877 [Colletotrichum tanaceti]|nr:hypothetical protein CTA2_12877 [Colletotrichum tanaceti]
MPSMSAPLRWSFTRTWWISSGLRGGCSFPSRTTTATASTCGPSTRKRMGLLSRRGCLAFDMCH